MSMWSASFRRGQAVESRAVWLNLAENFGWYLKDFRWNVKGKNLWGGVEKAG